MKLCKYVCRSVLIAQTLIALFIAIPPQIAHAAPVILISEIAWAGSSSSTADEWIELANLSQSSVDVSGWRLTGAGASGADIVLPPGTTIAPENTILIANYDAGNEKTALTVNPAVVTTTLSLANSAMLIALQDAQGMIVDRAGDGTAPFAGYASDAKASMIRVSATSAGDLPEAWTAATTTINLNTNDFGTPGILDIPINRENSSTADPCPQTPEKNNPIITTPDLELELSTTTTATANTTTTSPDPCPQTPEENNPTGTTPGLELGLKLNTTTASAINNSAAQVSSAQLAVQHVRLNEIMPNPTAGSEWIELVNQSDQAVSLIDLELWDASGKIKSLDGELTASSTYALIELTTAKLNNDGDSVYLKSTDGQIIDQFTYFESKQGAAYAKNESGAWQQTISLTPGYANIITVIQTTPVAQTTTVAQTNTGSDQTINTAVVELVPTNIEFLRLNEFMPAPENGVEWIELTSADPVKQITLDGAELFDAAGKIAALQGTITNSNPFLIVELNSARLNNGGDTVGIKSPDGNIIESHVYSEVGKGIALAKDANGTWQQTQTPTKGAANSISAPQTAETETAQTPDTTSVESENPDADETAAEETQTSDETVQNETASKNYTHLILNEFMPQPDGESEWVEIFNTGADLAVDLSGLEIHDASGRIANLEGTVGPLAYHLVALKSARLNNSGDTVSLKTKDGAVINSIAFEGSQKGISFARDSAGSWWETSTPTPGKTNQSGMNASEDKNSTPAVPDAKTESVTSAKSTTAKKSNAIIPITMDLTHNESFGGMRVMLQGTVGTPAGHVSGRAFVLLNHDGRGLVVRVPSSKKIPELGAFITVTGTLKFETHDLPYLSLTKNDDWIAMPNQNESPGFRNVSFLAPSNEDAWSLVAATGTVQEASRNTITLIVDDVEIQVKIRPGVAYLASRLGKGDQIAVTGVLDITGEQPCVMPRTADEIVLIEHAPEAIAKQDQRTEPQGLPGWTPFGAAALAVGMIEGGKRLKTKLSDMKTKKPIITMQTKNI